MLFTEDTISQIIKKKYKDIYKILYKSVYSFVKNNTNHFSEEIIETLVKWYIFNYLNYLKVNNLEDSQTLYRMFFYRGSEPIISNHVDYFSSKIDNAKLDTRLKSKLNNPSFFIDDLDEAIELWHASLESKNRTQGAEGNVVLDLSEPIDPKNISLLKGGWSGWKWVDLKKGYCDKESQSMGHCGNRGAKTGDTILSLRDENNIPHLTFILNDGKLGEMKGRNNNKPSEKYHPAILELLKLPIIHQVVGGGYKPENNFSLDDLNDEIKEKLLNFKPNLYFDVYKDLEEKMSKIRDYWDVDKF